MYRKAKKLEILLPDTACLFIAQLRARTETFAQCTYTQVLNDGAAALSELTSRLSVLCIAIQGCRRVFCYKFHHYVQKDMAYQNNLGYPATTATGNWNYGPEANNSYSDIFETLKKVMNRNPRLEVNIVAGYYDLTTPVGSTEYVSRHLGLKHVLRDNINVHYYESGQTKLIMPNSKHRAKALSKYPVRDLILCYAQL